MKSDKTAKSQPQQTVSPKIKKRVDSEQDIIQELESSYRSGQVPPYQEGRPFAPSAEWIPACIAQLQGCVDALKNVDRGNLRKSASEWRQKRHRLASLLSEAADLWLGLSADPLPPLSWEFEGISTDTPLSAVGWPGTVALLDWAAHIQGADPVILFSDARNAAEGLPLNLISESGGGATGDGAFNGLCVCALARFVPVKINRKSESSVDAKTIASLCALAGSTVSEPNVRSILQQRERSQVATAAD